MKKTIVRLIITSLLALFLAVGAFTATTVTQKAPEAHAASYCGMWLQPHVNYTVPWWIEHSHWLTANSGTDLTALTNSGRAWIYFYDEAGHWDYEALAAWTINTWGIHTTFVAQHYYSWFQNRWYIVYQC